jgi:hypothetical protein
MLRKHAYSFFFLSSKFSLSKYIENCERYERTKQDSMPVCMCRLRFSKHNIIRKNIHYKNHVFLRKMPNYTKPISSYLSPLFFLHSLSEVYAEGVEKVSYLANIPSLQSPLSCHILLFYLCLYLLVTCGHFCWTSYY